VDTYFHSANGKLKLRESETGATLIFYQREQKAGPKKSKVNMVPIADPITLKQLLSVAVGVDLVVEKQREIYWIKNVKFHLDTLLSRGTFIEFEAIDYDNSIGEAALYEQCQTYLKLFGIAENDLLTGSYSDMLAKK
jgi:predicted adenylyl cyclase CyaB